MQKNILVINGHPDPRPERFCAALCDAYQSGAREGGWSTRQLSVGDLPIPGQLGEASSAELDIARDAMAWASRILVVFPLWLDQAPVLLHSFLTRVFRDVELGSISPRNEVARSARSIVTMEMPALMLRSAFRAGAAGGGNFSLPGLAIEDLTLIGSVALLPVEKRLHWLATIKAQGALGQ